MGQQVVKVQNHKTGVVHQSGRAAVGKLRQVCRRRGFPVAVIHPEGSGCDESRQTVPLVRAVRLVGRVPERPGLRVFLLPLGPFPLVLRGAGRDERVEAAGFGDRFPVGAADDARQDVLHRAVSPAQVRRGPVGAD